MQDKRWDAGRTHEALHYRVAMRGGRGPVPPEAPAWLATAAAAVHRALGLDGAYTIPVIRLRVVYYAPSATWRLRPGDAGSEDEYAIAIDVYRSSQFDSLRPVTSVGFEAGQTLYVARCDPRRCAGSCLSMLWLCELCVMRETFHRAMRLVTDSRVQQ